MIRRLFLSWREGGSFPPLKREDAWSRVKKTQANHEYVIEGEGVFREDEFHPPAAELCVTINTKFAK